MTAMSPSSSARARPRRRTSPSRSAAISARPRSSPRRRSPSSASTEDALLDVGAELIRRPFRRRPAGRHPGRHPGQGLCQGGMKRWGFGGLRATHGVSVSHRSLGSTGQRQDPGKRLQEQEDGRPHGRQATAPSRISRSSAPTPSRGLHLRQGLGARLQGRLAAGQGRGQGRPPGRRALSRPASTRTAARRSSTRRRRPAWSRKPPSTRSRRCRATRKSPPSPPSRKPAPPRPTPPRPPPRTTDAEGDAPDADESKEG